MLEIDNPACELRDEGFAHEFLAGLVGVHQQVPPVYSAIKRAGKKACDEARSGKSIELEPREVEIYSAELLGIDESPREAAAKLVWEVRLHVSKGTYIRSIARDTGRALGCPAHVAALRRRAVGSLDIDECVGLEVLEALETLETKVHQVAVDPVTLLGFRAFFAREDVLRAVSHGASLDASAVELFEVMRLNYEERLDSCTSALRASTQPPADGELFSVLAEDRLAALYRWDGSSLRFKPSCVFQIGVSRGAPF